MEWISANANSIGVPALLMIALFGFWRGEIVTRREVDRRDADWKEKCGTLEQERDESREELRKQNSTLAELVSLLKMGQRT